MNRNELRQFIMENAKNLNELTARTKGYLIGGIPGLVGVAKFQKPESREKDLRKGLEKADQNLKKATSTGKPVDPIYKYNKEMSRYHWQHKLDKHIAKQAIVKKK